ncbi:sensor domain-containing diguanylate cyclase [Proteus faecis]|uniref:Sensor domain-containing diguanylate cyclase n=1 Tax=Proteus faecis TaxID=2050967 RepID=A0AAW7CUB8_9GAMM|nr:sensor domain-containing diguanylate cyclase [Proteus faecis]MDL5167775.1 sensor domain-containing diguanylate cyclase [Proteus faecis]MDL5275760.1 sensor domain-containing diguanylate cyclase [Proteus faecis]MDL5279173.1 sensor domain-containing diguanylate cyclase [Proteus faecis]MDL5308175.1 sensor domain-containing diguanylate cyclase [Proteus faecis]MDL5311891.1 sensor domain-containing diguanylate cyclase [Proteus faecis]
MNDMIFNDDNSKCLLIKQFTNNVFMMLVTDINGIIIYANDKYCEFNNVHFKNIKGKKYSLFNLIDENQINCCENSNNDNKGVYRLEAKRNNNTQQDIWEDISIIPVFDKDDFISHYVFISLDITDKVELRNELFNKSYVDSLTGISNRLSIIERIENERLNISQPLSFCLGIIDCDKFKSINDQFGHHAGDKVLCEISKRLSQLENKEVYCGRLGGDEFAVLFPKGLRSCSVILLEIIELLWKSMEKPININSEFMLTPSISLGIAEYPKDGKTLSELLKSADKTLYSIKEMGGNKYGFYSGF